MVKFASNLTEFGFLFELWVAYYHEFLSFNSLLFENLQFHYILWRFKALPSNFVLNYPIVASVVAESPFTKESGFFEIGKFIFYVS